MAGLETVSVIVPCFNLGQYLEDAVDSARAQTHRDLEIVVVNDGSTDEGTLRALDRLRATEVIVVDSENRGLGAARSLGVSRSRGAFLLPLDADDLIRPTYVERTLAVLRERPEVKIAYAQTELFGEERGVWDMPYAFPEILWRNLIVCTALVRRGDYERAGGYKTMTYMGWEDWDLWLSIIDSAVTPPEHIGYQVPEPLFRYRIRGPSMIRSLDEGRNRTLRREIFLNHLELYCRHGEDPVNLKYRLDRLEREHDRMRRNYEGLQRSRALKLGRLLLSPLEALRRRLRDGESR